MNRMLLRIWVSQDFFVNRFLDYCLEETMGFEPMDLLRSSPFQGDAIGHSATSPKSFSVTTFISAAVCWK